MRFIKPIGLYPPLVLGSQDTSSKTKLRLLALANLTMRFLSYPFNYTISAIITAAMVLTATFFNLLWCFGGFFSNNLSKKTKLFNAIAITRCGWTIIDPFAFLWNQGALLAGIFNTRIARHVMTMLGQVTEDLTKDVKNYLRAQSIHFSKMKWTAQGLLDKSRYTLNRIVATIILEPVAIISMAILFPLGWKKNLTRYGLNPSELTPAQQAYRPVLFLHGDLHNSSGALNLAKYFRKKNKDIPVFTINYPTQAANSTDLIRAKMNEIRDLYPEAQRAGVSIDLIGHSHGSLEIRDLNDQKNNSSTVTINRALLLAPPLCMDLPNSQDKKENMHYIHGKHDHFFEPREKSDFLNPENHFFASAGHVGLLSDPDVLEHCYEVIAAP